jgi:hypothetical protein
MSMFEIKYGQNGVKTRMKSKTGPLRPENVCRLFHGLSIGFVLLQSFRLELHSIHHGHRWIPGPLLEKFFREGGVLNEENR